MKKIYLLLSFLSITLISFAQSNYKPGFVVTTTGDTLKGYIDYKEWISNPATINFKTQAGKTSNYTPANARYVNIDNLEFYERYEGPVSLDETSSNRILAGRDTSFNIKTVFLKVLQTGPTVNLYAYKDEIKTRYFYKSPLNGDVVNELIYRIYKNGGTFSVQKTNTTVEATFIQQLSSIALKANIFDDHLQRMFEGVEYTQSDLLKIVTSMNGYTDLQIASAHPADSNKSFNLYAGVGVNITSSKSFDQNSAPVGTPNTSVMPRAVVAINAYANPNTRRLVFYAELSITDIKYHDSFFRTNFSFDQVITTLTPGISYNVYNADNLKFFLSFGLGISKYDIVNKKLSKYDGTALPPENLPFVFSNFNTAITYKVGVLISKKFQLYGEHLSGNPISRDGFFTVKQQSNNIGVNYLFGR